MKEGEGNSQRTNMHDPWTKTTVWGWPGVGGDGGWVEMGKRGNSGGNYIA